MRLISMSDFVLNKNENLKNAPDAYDQYCEMVNYARFLKEPLNRGMFIPVDEKGNIINEPTDQYSSPQYYEAEMHEYLKAKERIIFQGFEICNRNPRQDCVRNKNFHLSTDFQYTKTIEDLISRTYIYLTPQAVKKYQLKTDM